MPPQRTLNFDGHSDEAREAARAARALITARLSDLCDGDRNMGLSIGQVADVTGDIMRSDDPERALTLLTLALTAAAASAVRGLADANDLEPSETMQRIVLVWEQRDATI